MGTEMGIFDRSTRPTYGQMDKWTDHEQISGTISKMALNSDGTSVLHKRLSAGLDNQLEFPRKFLFSTKNLD